MQQVPGDVEEFIVKVIFKQFAPLRQVEDADIEGLATVDLGDDFLVPKEVKYYLNLS